VLSNHLSLLDRAKAGIKYWRVRRTGQPLLVNFEVMEFCNAKCDFCNCWHSKYRKEVVDWDDVVKYMDPFVVAVTGGEPLIRKDLPDIVQKIKASSIFTYAYMVTNGSLLTEEKADALMDAGLDHLAISMNWPDSRQDEERGLPNLMQHLEEIIPALTDKGIPIGMHTVMMKDNVDELVPIALKARDWNASVSFSAYTDSKNGNAEHLLNEDDIQRLEKSIQELLKLKCSDKMISTSQFYFDKAVSYFRNGGIPGCMGGIKFVQLTADGYVKRCADWDPFAHYTEFKPLEENTCTRCYYSCRGETESALTLSRLVELARS
jgi:MoaA/NifB/PqqE/SkfB family radical SAM enzyme